jgi:PST family polysaccharide transporter
MDKASSFRQIIKSSSIIGGAAVINIILGIVRTKIIALLLGPAGIGLVGVLQNILMTANVVATCGIGTAGTKLIADSNEKKPREGLVVVRSTIFWLALFLSATGTILFFLLRDFIAVWVFNDPYFSTQLGWLSIAVGFSVAASSQNSILNGARRIGDMAKVAILSSIFSSFLGVVGIYYMGDLGIVVFVLLIPILNFTFGSYYLRLSPIGSVGRVNREQFLSTSRRLLSIGAPYMLAILVTTLSQLIIRAIIQRSLGLEALGLFQASWGISMIYIIFILRAMGTDFFPRLTVVIGNNKNADNLINEQTEVGLFIAGPLLVMTLGMAPWIIDLLYTEDFSAAAVLLSWQVIGDILKVVSSPLGFVLLSAGAGKMFFFAESFASIIFISVVFFGIEQYGLPIVGVGYFIMYVAYLIVTCIFAKIVLGYSWNRRVIAHFFMLFSFSFFLLFVSSFSESVAACISICFGIFYSIYSIRYLAISSEIDIGVLKDKIMRKKF